jgi:hypothetical protein
MTATGRSPIAGHPRVRTMEGVEADALGYVVWNHGLEPVLRRI